MRGRRWRNSSNRNRRSRTLVATTMTTRRSTAFSVSSALFERELRADGGQARLPAFGILAAVFGAELEREVLTRQR